MHVAATGGLWNGIAHSPFDELPKPESGAKSFQLSRVFVNSVLTDGLSRRIAASVLADIADPTVDLHAKGLVAEIPNTYFIQDSDIDVTVDQMVDIVFKTENGILSFEEPSPTEELKWKRWTEWRDVHKKDIRYNWICLNGRTRAYRQEVYNLLRHEPSGFVSHSIFNPIEIHPYEKYDFDNVQNFIHLMPIYQSARMSVITESLYQDVGGIVTEKTLLAIAARHPFMCIGHRFCHDDVARLGFQNYNELFDLSYDTEDHTTRMYSAVKLNLARLQAPIDQDAVKEKVDANFDWLMGGYTDSIVDRAKQDLRILFEKSL